MATKCPFCGKRNPPGSEACVECGATILDRDREAAFYACALDPLTASIVPLHEIREMFEELWEAEGDLLVWFDPDHKGPLPERCAA